MGDGVVRKHAIILNGDTEARHLDNVDRAARVLKRGGYKIHVASPSRPKVGVYRYYTHSLRNVKRLIAGVRAKIDDDDVLVIYKTGHGQDRKEFCLKDGCVRNPVLNQLDALKYGQRVFVIDSCYGGNLGHYITDNPRSLFISAGTKGIAVCCSNFAPTFWKPASQLSDPSRDGAISWQERFAAAYKGHRDEARLFLRSKGFRDFDVERGRSARPNFPAAVTMVNNHTQLKAQLGKLKPGEYAVLNFSMQGCLGCIQYRPRFDAMARAAGGRHLFLRTNSDALRQRYGVTTVPRVVIIDAFGKVHQVPNIMKIFDRLATLNLSPIAIAVACVRSYVIRPGSRTTAELHNALRRIMQNFKHVTKVDANDLAPILRSLFTSWNSSTYAAAVLIYRALIPLLGHAAAASEARGMRALLKGHDSDARRAVYALYPGVVRRMTSQALRVETAGLRALFPRHYAFESEAVAELYAAAFSNLSDAARKVEAPRVRALFAGGFAERAAVFAYGMVGSHLSPSEAAKGAHALRRMLGSTANREAMILTYGRIASKLTAAEALLGARAIRTIATSGYYRYVQLGVDAYAAVIRRLNGNGAGAEVRALRALFPNYDSDVRSSAFRFYGALAYKLSVQDTDIGASALRAAFRDQDDAVRKSAIIAYGQLAKKMSRSEALLGAAALRAAVKKSNKGTLGAIYASYASLASKLAPGEAVLGAKILRAALGGVYGDTAMKAYVQVFKSLNARQRTAEALMLRKTIRGCNCMLSDSSLGSIRHPDVARTVITLGMIAPYLSVSDAALSAAKVRSLFWTNATLHHNVLTAYRRLVQKLGAVDLDREAARMRHLFWHGSSSRVVDAAVFAHAAIVKRMSDAALALESARVRVLLKSGQAKPAEAAAQALTAMVPRLSGTEAHRAAIGLRKIMLRWKGGITLYATRAYYTLVPRLSTTAARSEARALRAQFNSRYNTTRAFSIGGYGFVASKLDPYEIARGAVALRTQMKSAEMFPFALGSYARIAYGVSAREAARGAPLLRKALANDSSSIRMMAAHGYCALASKLKIAELAKGKRVLLTLITDRDARARQEAKKALAAVTLRLKQLQPRPRP